MRFLLEQQDEKTYLLPEFNKRMFKKYYPAYDIKIIDVEDAINFNKLLNDNSVLSRREHIWGNSYNDYKIKLNKMDYNMDDPMRFVKRDGGFKVLDGAHRLIALHNSGYDKVEVLVKED